MAVATRTRSCCCALVYCNLILAPLLSSAFQALEAPLNQRIFQQRQRRNFSNSVSIHHHSRLFLSSNTTPSTDSIPYSSIQRNGAFPAKIQKKHAAVLINRNARSVTASTVAIAEDVFGAEHVYVSSTATEAETIARIVKEQYDVVVPMGGDGTLTTCINNMMATPAKEEVWRDEPAATLRSLPMIAYVPRGTGNGVGSVVSCSPKTRGNKALRQVLTRIRDLDRSAIDTVVLPLLHVQAENHTDAFCFFTGGKLVVPVRSNVYYPKAC